jgi:UDP-N-acetylmuramyl tripeptide synthase
MPNKPEDGSKACEFEVAVFTNLTQDRLELIWRVENDATAQLQKVYCLARS